MEQEIKALKLTVQQFATDLANCVFAKNTESVALHERITALAAENEALKLEVAALKAE